MELGEFDRCTDAPAQMRILHRDEQVIAIDKPAGSLSVPGRLGDRAIWQEVQELAPEALPVHRLDRDTSGVLLFALGKEAHRALSVAFEDRLAEKRYLALCRGDLAAPTDCKLALVKLRKGGMRVATGRDHGALPSATGFAPLERFGGVTLIEARPRTGRTHQIRVHLAAIGHALLIDPRYGETEALPASEFEPGAAAADELVLARTPLHAAALRVPHPSGQGWLSVESPLPADLARCLELLRRARRG